MIAVVSEQIPQLAEIRLRELGYRIQKLPPHPALPAPVASHPDMLLFFAPDAILCTESYLRIATRELTAIARAVGLPIRPVAQDYGPNYPHDILLNAASIGKYLFCLPSHTAKEIQAIPQITLCAVRQGYAKCSTVPVGDHALITEDPSIATAAKAHGLEALQISPNNVRLPGYDTGFLGGACSYAPYHDPKELLMCGNLALHKEADAILAFLHRNGKKAVLLTDSPLTDVGTVFII